MRVGPGFASPHLDQAVRREIVAADVGEILDVALCAT